MMRGAHFGAMVLGRGPLVVGQDCNSAGLTCKVGNPMLLILHTHRHKQQQVSKVGNPMLLILYTHRHKQQQVSKVGNPMLLILHTVRSSL